MRILITGAGDIGAPLAERLVSAGHRVVVYDRERRALPAGVRFVEGDVRDAERLATAAEGCDRGIHLAALGGAADPAEIVSVNVSGALNFLTVARQAGFRNCVIVSSAPVHLPPGDGDNGFPLRTSGGEDRVYDLSKSLQEVLAADFHAHGVPVLCLRLGHVVLGAAEMTLRGAPLREETYCRGGLVALEDVVEACAAALNMPPSGAFEILNIVGARGARERFRVAEAEGRLGIMLGYDFAAYE